MLEFDVFHAREAVADREITPRERDRPLDLHDPWNDGSARKVASEEVQVVRYDELDLGRISAANAVLDDDRIDDAR